MKVFRPISTLVVKVTQKAVRIQIITRYTHWADLIRRLKTVISCVISLGVVNVAYAGGVGFLDGGDHVGVTLCHVVVHVRIVLCKQHSVDI